MRCLILSLLLCVTAVILTFDFWSFLLYTPKVKEFNKDAMKKEVDDLLNAQLNAGLVSPPFPAEIASLQPQLVEVVEQDGKRALLVQVSGGFRHFGYIFVVGEPPESFRPRVGKFKIERLYNNVFTFRE